MLCVGLMIAVIAVRELRRSVCVDLVASACGERAGRFHADVAVVDAVPGIDAFLGEV